MERLITTLQRATPSGPSGSIARASGVYRDLVPTGSRADLLLIFWSVEAGASRGYVADLSPHLYHAMCPLVPSGPALKQLRLTGVQAFAPFLPRGVVLNGRLPRYVPLRHRLGLSL